MDDVSAADSAAGGFIYTKLGCFLQRVNSIQRFGMANKPIHKDQLFLQITIALSLLRLYQSTKEETHWQASYLLRQGQFG